MLYYSKKNTPKAERGTIFDPEKLQEALDYLESEKTMSPASYSDMDRRASMHNSYIAKRDHQLALREAGMAEKAEMDRHAESLRAEADAFESANSPEAKQTEKLQSEINTLAEVDVPEEALGKIVDYMNKKLDEGKNIDGLAVEMAKVAAFQEGLQKKGLYDGDIDGIWGKKTADGYNDLMMESRRVSTLPEAVPAAELYREIGHGPEKPAPALIQRHTVKVDTPAPTRKEARRGRKKVRKTARKEKRTTRKENRKKSDGGILYNSGTAMKAQKGVVVLPEAEPTQLVRVPAPKAVQIGRTYPQYYVDQQIEWQNAMEEYDRSSTPAAIEASRRSNNTKRLQEELGVATDGDWGPISEEALQVRLAENRAKGLTAKYNRIGEAAYPKNTQRTPLAHYANPYRIESNKKYWEHYNEGGQKRARDSRNRSIEDNAKWQGDNFEAWATRMRGQ